MQFLLVRSIFYFICVLYIVQSCFVNYKINVMSYVFYIYIFFVTTNSYVNTRFCVESSKYSLRDRSTRSDYM